MNKSIQDYQFSHAIQGVYNFFWHSFADIYIEKSKKQIREAKTKEEAERTKKNLVFILFASLKLLHPFMPFVTEEIYQSLPLKKKTQLAIEYWPKI